MKPPMTATLLLVVKQYGAPLQMSLPIYFPPQQFMSLESRVRTS